LIRRPYYHTNRYFLYRVWCFILYFICEQNGVCADDQYYRRYICVWYALFTVHKLLWNTCRCQYYFPYLM